MGMKATRHNGRAGKFGAYNVKHNDRNFDVNRRTIDKRDRQQEKSRRRSRGMEI